MQEDKSSRYPLVGRNWTPLHRKLPCHGRCRCSPYVRGLLMGELRKTRDVAPLTTCLLRATCPAHGATATVIHLFIDIYQSADDNPGRAKDGACINTAHRVHWTRSEYPCGVRHCSVGERGSDGRGGGYSTAREGHAAGGSRVPDAQRESAGRVSRERRVTLNGRCVPSAAPARAGAAVRRPSPPVHQKPPLSR